MPRAERARVRNEVAEQFKCYSEEPGLRAKYQRLGSYDEDNDPDCDFQSDSFPIQHPDVSADKLLEWFSSKLDRQYPYIQGIKLAMLLEKVANLIWDWSDVVRDDSEKSFVAIIEECGGRRGRRRDDDPFPIADSID